MRKFISLGLLTLSFGLFCNPVLAGNVEDCEVLVDSASKGLYGLCIAWHNAGNDNARDRILENYEKKRGPGDPPMPGTEDEVPCPCWGTTELLDAACNRVLGESGVDFATFDGGLVQFFNFSSPDSSCVYSNFLAGELSFSATDAEQYLTCQAELEALINDDLLEFCP